MAASAFPMFADLPAASQGATPKAPPPSPADFPMFADLLPNAGQPVAGGDHPLTIHGGMRPSPEIEVDIRDPRAIREAFDTLDPNQAPSMGASAYRGGVAGATMNFGDELRGLAAAGGNPLIPGSQLVGGLRMAGEALAPDTFGHTATDRYNRAVSQARAENDIAQQTNPGSYFAGEMMGGLAALPIAPELAPFKAAEGAGVVTRGAAALGNMATAGAAYGAVAGAGGGEDLSSRGSGALLGAAMGGAINPAFGTAARAVTGSLGRGIRMLRDQYTALNDPQVIADRVVARRMAQDGMTPADLVEGMTEPPAPVMDNGAVVTPQGPRAPSSVMTAADAGGANLKGLAGTVTRMPGEAQQRARQFLDARQFGSDEVPSQNERLQDAITTMMGGRNLAADAIDTIATTRSAQARPAYEAAHAVPISTTPALASLLDKPSVRAAIPLAARKLADDLPGSSIFAKPGSRWERDVMGEAPIGEPPVDRPFAPADTYEPPARGMKPTEPRPMSLVSFLQAAGGVRDSGGDLKHMGLDRFPGLVRQSGGLSPDMARQAAAQAGYLGADVDRAMADTGINDLFDALERHPAYSVHDDHAVHAWEVYDGHLADRSRMSGSVSWSAAPPRAPGAPDGGAAGEAPPDLTMRGWDYIKRALDDRIGQAKRAGSADDVRIFAKLKSALTGELDRVNPAYGTARKIYAGHSEMIDAVEAGQTAFQPSTSAEDMRRTLAGLKSLAEKEAYRMSAAKALKDRLAGLPDGSDKARAVAGSPELRAKIAAVAPDEASRNRLMAYIVNERAIVQTRTRATGGSPTASNLAEDIGTAESMERVREGIHAVKNLSSGHIAGLMIQAARYLQKISPERRSAVMEEVRKVILSPDPSAVRSLEDRMAAAAVPSEARQAVRSVLRTGLSTSTTAAARALVTDATGRSPNRRSDETAARPRLLPTR